MQIYWNKRKCLHKKRFQIPHDWLGTPTWPPFHCFGTPIWPPRRHVKTLYIDKTSNLKLDTYLDESILHKSFSCGTEMMVGKNWIYRLTRRRFQCHHWLHLCLKKLPPFETQYLSPFFFALSYDSLS